MTTNARDDAWIHSDDCYRRWKSLEKKLGDRPTDKHLMALVCEAKGDYEDSIKNLYQYFFPAEQRRKHG